MITMNDQIVSKPKTIRTKVFCARMDDEYTLIHKSEAQCWNELRERSAWYDSSQDHLWSVSVSEEEVPVAEGSNHDWAAEGGSAGVRVHWFCPYCNKEHYCDEDPYDQSPHLWFCENGNGIVLVDVPHP